MAMMRGLSIQTNFFRRQAEVALTREAQMVDVWKKDVLVEVVVVVEVTVTVTC